MQDTDDDPGPAPQGRAVKLLQVSVGRPRTVRWHGERVSTGIFKAPVQGPVGVRFTNLEGDGQADRSVHGGWEKAVYAYPAEFYSSWRAERPELELPFGQFGENLTTEGLPDDTVCAGDRFRIGTAELIVTEPRLPCFKLGIKMGDDAFVAQFLARGLFGFYLAVVREGRLQAGDEIVTLERHPARFPVTDIARLYGRDREDVEGLRRAAALDVVPESWRRHFDAQMRRLERRHGTRLRPDPPAPAWEGYRPLRVRDKVQETADVVSIYLDDPSAAPLPAHRPGQHLTLRFPIGKGTGEVRSYSLSDRPRSDAYRLTIKRVHAEARVSSWVHHHLHVGDTLEAKAPGGGFALDVREVQRPVVLLGAGIGITPLLAMLNAIAEHGRPRETWLFYGVRDATEQLMADQLEQLARRHDWLRLEVCQSRPGNGGAPSGARRIDLALLRERLPNSSYDYYLCGPPAFMQDIHAGLSEWGVPDYRIHFEAFGPASVGSLADPSTLPVGAAAVRFAASDVEAVWRRDSELTLLELAEDKGVQIPFGCRAGSCGTCATRLLAGAVAYLRDPDAPVRDDELLPCVAYPAAPVELDV